MRPALLFLSSMSESASSSFASATERVLEIGARIEHSPSDRLIQTVFKRELDDQLPLFESMTWVDLAHTIVMIENKFIPIEAGRELIEALLHLQSCSGDFVPDPYKGDLYTNREAWLNEHSSSSHWLGAGRARQHEQDRRARRVKLAADQDSTRARDARQFGQRASQRRDVPERQRADRHVGGLRQDRQRLDVPAHELRRRNLHAVEHSL